MYFVLKQVINLLKVVLCTQQEKNPVKGATDVLTAEK